MTTPREEPDAEALLAERRHLLNLGYRMLGSVAEAEDAVQATYARWYALTAEQRAEVDSVGAWLTTVASRICLDVLRSARVRREVYVGEWVPEPLPEGSDATADPSDRVTLDESVGMAFLVVLEAMTPAERVVFILHDVYRYPFTEIAEIVGRSPGACRQLASSARRRIDASRTPEAPAAERADLVRRFQRAWETHDVDALLTLLDPEAIVVADGGGRAKAALRPVEGSEKVARYLVGILAAMPGLSLRPSTVNGAPGLVAERDGTELTVFAFHVAAGRIQRIWAVRNPDKLRLWT